jgi:nitrogen-specific signal transduction histidine kinase
LLVSEGRGRGIEISLRLVKHMGGTLELETRDGQTIFRIFLPMVNEPVAGGTTFRTRTQ